MLADLNYLLKFDVEVPRLEELSFRDFPVYFSANLLKFLSNLLHVKKGEIFKFQLRSPLICHYLSLRFSLSERLKNSFGFLLYLPNYSNLSFESFQDCIFKAKFRELNWCD